MMLLEYSVGLPLWGLLSGSLQASSLALKVESKLEEGESLSPALDS